MTGMRPHRNRPRPCCRILLVEDDPDVALVIGAMLGELGHRFAHLRSADQARDRLGRRHLFDLVIADIVLPGAISGLDLAREAARRWPGLPLILVTGHPDAGRIAGDEGFRLLFKPFAFNRLAAEIDAAIGATPWGRR